MSNCNRIFLCGTENLAGFCLDAESYLLALCESDRKTQILDVLKNIDIINLRSIESIVHIFQSLGRLLLESDAENLLLDLRACGMIFSYPSTSVDDNRGGALSVLEKKMYRFIYVLFFSLEFCVWGYTIRVKI